MVLIFYACKKNYLHKNFVFLFKDLTLVNCV